MIRENPELFALANQEMTKHGLDALKSGRPVNLSLHLEKSGIREGNLYICKEKLSGEVVRYDITAMAKEKN